MRALFILCTTLTVVQVLDFSIIGVSADTKGIPITSVPINGATKTSSNAVKQSQSTKEANPTSAKPQSPSSTVNSPTKSSENDAEGTPEQFSDAGKNLVKTITTEANKRGAGVLNTASGLVKATSGSIGFLGNFMRGQSNNVLDISKVKFGMLSSLGDTATKGTINVMNSAKEIGKENAKTMSSTLKHATDLGVNVSKLGGTVINTPFSVGNDVLGVTNKVATIPMKMSKSVTNVLHEKVLPAGDDEINDRGDNLNGSH